MVKRFHIGKLYTLCLARTIENDIHTFTVNVLFGVRFQNKVEFKDTDNYYIVNLNTMECTRIDKITNEQLSCTCTNIVTGWQW